MKRITTFSIAIVVLLMVVGYSTPVLAKHDKSEPAEKQLSQTELPQAVMTTVQKSFPGAVIMQIVQEIENGRQVYDVETKEGSIERDLLLLPDGSLIEVGEHISVSSLPAAVRDAALKAHPSGAITGAELKTINGVVRYDVTMEANGQTQELFFSPAGDQLTSVDDDAGDEDDKGDDD